MRVPSNMTRAYLHVHAGAELFIYRYGYVGQAALMIEQVAQIKESLHKIIPPFNYSSRDPQQIMIVAPRGLSGPSSDASWTNTGFIQAKMQALAHTVSPKASLAFCGFPILPALALTIFFAIRQVC